MVMYCTYNNVTECEIRFEIKFFPPVSSPEKDAVGKGGGMFLLRCGGLFCNHMSGFLLVLVVKKK
jgi:hypothetical protein